jgi:formylglycine-generating enzyme
MLKLPLLRPWIEFAMLTLFLGGLSGGCDGSKTGLAPREAGVSSDCCASDMGNAEVALQDALGADVASPDTTLGAPQASEVARWDAQSLDAIGLDPARPEGGSLDAQSTDTAGVDSGDDVPTIAPEVGDAFIRIDSGGDADGKNDPTACPGSGGPAMVRLPEGYCIDRTEVTRVQYEAWLATNPTTAGQDSRCAWNTTFTPPAWCAAVACQGADCGGHPQTCVDWCDAYAYCKAVGKRLCGARAGGPVEFDDGYADANQSQWFNACSSGGAQAFPYGDTYDKTRCNGSDSGLAKTAPTGSLVGCQSAVPAYGSVFDLSGNVDEWEDACNGAAGPTDKCRLRGGSYGTYYLGMDCNQDFSLRRDLITQTQGIRCCSQ